MDGGEEEVREVSQGSRVNAGTLIKCFLASVRIRSPHGAKVISVEAHSRYGTAGTAQPVLPSRYGPAGTA